MNNNNYIESELVAVQPFTTFPDYGITIVLQSKFGKTKHISINAEQWKALQIILLNP